MYGEFETVVLDLKTARISKGAIQIPLCSAGRLVEEINLPVGSHSTACMAITGLMTDFFHDAHLTTFWDVEL